MSEFVRGAMRLHILHHAEMAPIQSAWMAAELAATATTSAPTPCLQCCFACTPTIC